MSGTMPLHAAASPGNVIINGQVTYQPRDWNGISNYRTGNEMKIDLYEKDLQGRRHYLDTTNTDGNGNFTFPSKDLGHLTNWWGFDGQQLNIYFVIETVYPNTSVTDRSFAQYAFDNYNDPTFLSYDGTWTKNFVVTQSWPDYQAIWIFEDLRNTWNYVHNNDFRNGVPYNPGNVTAVWEPSLNCWPTQLPDWLNIPCGSFSYGGIPIHFIFIADNQNTSMDVVVHETGHMFMINANGYWYLGCLMHSIPSISDAHCAWAEGWADFLPLPVNGDQCYNFVPNPCDGIADQNYYNLEVHSRTDNPNIPNPFYWGDTVEGRVAAALYDLYDSNNEGYDRRSAGFDPISNIALGSNQITTFHDFWSAWIDSDQDQFLSGLTLWWNTINYDNIQQIFLPAISK